MAEQPTTAARWSRDLFGRLADWEMDHRLWVLLFLVAISAGAGALLPQLEFDFRPEALMEFSAEEERFERDFREQFRIQDNVLLLIVSGSEPGSVLTPRGLELLHRLTERAAGSEISTRAVSLTTLPDRRRAVAFGALGLEPPPLVPSLPVTEERAEAVRSQVASSRMIPGQLVSVDGSTAVVVVVLEPLYQRDHSALDRPLAALEGELRGMLREEGEAAPAGAASFRLQLGGHPFVRVETVRNLKSEQRFFWPATAVLYLLLLWVIYRDPVLTVVPLLAVGLASLWGMALLPLTGTEVNVINNIVPTLILVIGVCNGIHMLHGFREARWEGLDARAATRRMMVELGLPAFLTSATTAVGFASLLVARNGTLRQLGWQASGGIMLSYLALVTLLPLVLSWLGDRTREPRRGGPVEHAGLERLAAAVGRRPRLALGASLVVFAVALASGSGIPVDAHFSDTFPPGHPIHESKRLVEEKLGGLLPLELHFHSDVPGFFADPERLQRIFEIENELLELPQVLRVSSPVDLVAEVHGVRDDERVGELLTGPQVASALGTLEARQPAALAQYLSEDRSELRLSARLSDRGIRASLRTIDVIEAERGRWLAPWDGHVSLRLTGQAYIAARGLDYFIRDLFLSLATASVVIFLMLALVFRSPRIGLLSVLPTILPLALTLGLIPLYGYDLNTNTTVVFTITIGMAVDNTIHLLARFRICRREGLSVHDALARTYRQAGAAVVASNLLLMAGFSILFLSDFSPIFRVATLTTTTIAAALLAALLVLPELLVLFGGPIGRKPKRY